MNKYLVKYTVTTKSRCSAYIYKERTEIDAENPKDAADYVKTNAPKWFGFKRCSVSVISISDPIK